MYTTTLRYRRGDRVRLTPPALAEMGLEDREYVVMDLQPAFSGVPAGYHLRGVKHWLILDEHIVTPSAPEESL